MNVAMQTTVSFVLLPSKLRFCEQVFNYAIESLTTPAKSLKINPCDSTKNKKMNIKY